MTAQKLALKNQGRYPLLVYYGRLRARHGASVIGGIVRRIQEADLLLFDFTDLNHNVLFEAGCAVSTKGPDSGQVFILMARDQFNSIPSDLIGFMVTLLEDGRLVDGPGFRAALLASIITAARDRGMWEDHQAELPEDPQPTKPQEPDFQCNSALDEPQENP